MLTRLAVLLIGLFIIQATVHGEPLYPLLRSKSVDSLQTSLTHTQPDRNRINTLLALSSDLITRHEELDTDLGKAYAYCKQAELLSSNLHVRDGQIRSQCLLGRIEGIKGNRKQAETQLRNVLAYYTEQNNLTEQAAICYFLGNLYKQTPDELPKKISCYQQAMRLFQQIGRVDKQAYMLKAVADMHAQQGNWSLAEKELFQVLALYRSIHYRQLQYTYDLLSSIHHGLANYDQALKYELVTLEIATANQDSVYLGSFHFNLGILYDELKQWQTAIIHYQKAIPLFAKVGALPIVHFIANNLCGLLITHANPAKALAFYSQILRQYPLRTNSDHFATYATLAECHLALKHYSIAETYYKKLVALQAGKPVSQPVIATYIKIGTFYGIVQQYDKARSYLNQALSLLQQIGYKRGTPSVHLQLFKIDSAQHRYPSAIVHYQKFKALSDSIFSEKKGKQIAALEIQYNTRKKEQDIALLTRQNQLQQARIREKDLQRNGSIAGTMLLAGLLGVSYNRYRLKQRNNQLLEAKQLEINRKNDSLVQILDEKENLLVEKEWMLKEIHHRVKNNLQIISSLLNAQSDLLQDPNALMAIKDSQNRVHAMALIHQKLYQSDSLARINMAEFIEEIVDYLLESFTQQTSVRAAYKLAPGQLDVAQAIPIGLIINEAVTNSLKYAFPQQRSGTITVLFHPIDLHTYQLTITDDGVGLPVGFDIHRNDTLGMTMMRGLCQQIGGQLTISQTIGVQIQIVFQPILNVKRSIEQSVG